jgi:hypothetical protein
MSNYTTSHPRRLYLQQVYTVINLPATLSVFNTFIAPMYVPNVELKMADWRTFDSE